MPNSNNHSISEQELDNLLKQAFLNLDSTNPKNEEIMETVANQTFSPATNSIVEGSKHLISGKFIIAIISVVLVSIAIILFYLFNTPKQITGKNKAEPALLTDSNSPQNPNTKELILPLAKGSDSVLPVIKNKGIIMQNTNQTNTALSVKNEAPVAITLPQETSSKGEDTAYVFPVLTAEEIKQNEKRKEKMVNQSLKFSRDNYSLIPQYNHTSSYWYERGFSSELFMQNHEVSNIEYKTFLFDLLIHNDKVAFLKAKPDQKLWNTIYDAALGKYYENNYFSDKKYNDYPVVNISKEAAELYCKWLQKTSETVANEKDIFFDRTYSLPSVKDWAYAAEGGDSKDEFPWDGIFIRNSKGLYLANFCIQKQKEKLEPNQTSTKYTSWGLGSSQEVLISPVNSYKPNNFGLYNMSGNVAEFVVDPNSQELLVKGGSWNSSMDELKISATEKAKTSGASPYNGFRIMIENSYQALPFAGLDANNPDFVFPKFTRAQLKESAAYKEKMIKQAASYSKDTYAYVNKGSCNYNGQMVSSQAFYMQTTEVSNKEYKTFLMDLFANNRKEEFKENLPDQKQWTKMIGDSFLEAEEHMYFTHPAYDDYPVVTISKKNAEAYCNWLTMETNVYLAANKKPLINDLRIPTDYEWALAASNKTNHTVYANGMDSLKEKGKYTVNYSCRKYADTRYDERYDNYSFKEKNKEDIGFIADGGFFTTYIKTYKTNKYGIYNMAGNVSEMVYLWDAKTNKVIGFGTKGGSWYSTDYFLEIDAKQEFTHPEKPSPLRGFRPVMTAPVKR